MIVERHKQYDKYVSVVGTKAFFATAARSMSDELDVWHVGFTVMAKREIAFSLFKFINTNGYGGRFQRRNQKTGIVNSFVCVIEAPESNTFDE